MAAPNPAFVHMFTDANLVRFGEEYVRNGGNGKLALHTVFPDDTPTPEQTNALVTRLKRAEIVRKLRSRAASKALTAATVAINRYAATETTAANTLARLAFTDYRQIMDWDRITDPDTGEKRMVVSIKAAKDIEQDAHAAISEVTQRPDGSITIKLADKRAAIMDLARLKGWIQDKPEPVVAAVQLIIQR
jgi:phage terminase small subunit